MRLHSAKGHCLRCNAGWNAHNAQGLAAQHEKSTGHLVEVTLTYRSHDVPKGKPQGAMLPLDQPPPRR